MKGNMPREQRTIPNGDQTPRGSPGGKKFKIGKFGGGAEFFYVRDVKIFSLSFLKANNITARLINFISKSNPFFPELIPLIFQFKIFQIILLSIKKPVVCRMMG